MALSIYEKTEIINHSQDDIDPLATEQSWQILLAGLTLVFMRKCFFLPNRVPGGGGSIAKSCLTLGTPRTAVHQDLLVRFPR